MTEFVDVPYIEEPTLVDLLKALPRRLSPQARLTLLVFWEDAARRSGPTEITVAEVAAITQMSRASVCRAIADLRAASLLTCSRRYTFATGSRWIRFLSSPLVIAPEGTT
ncbi:MAG: hypothetical protein Q7U75_04030 [Desulfobacterales bacterium]|nr:hypothetical protein [Desulfobacterales bacterium]